MIRGLFIIFIFLGVGEGLHFLLDLPVAGNILGMILIILALQLKLIKLEWVKPASDKLLQFLVLFFIPYGVGLMIYFDLIASYWWPITLTIVTRSK